MKRFVGWCFFVSSVVAVANVPGAKYTVPVADEDLKSTATFSLPDAAVKLAEDTIVFSYTLPPELVGDKPELKAVFRPSHRGMVNQKTFPVRGLIVEGPCLFPHEDPQEKIPACPEVRTYQDKEVVGIANARCRWTEDRKSFTCQISYSNLEEAMSEAARDAYCVKKAGTDLPLLDRYRRIGAFFGHDPAGTLEFEVK